MALLEMMQDAGFDTFKCRSGPERRSRSKDPFFFKSVMLFRNYLLLIFLCLSGFLGFLQN